MDVDQALAVVGPGLLEEMWSRADTGMALLCPKTVVSRPHKEMKMGLNRELGTQNIQYNQRKKTRQR